MTRKKSLVSSLPLAGVMVMAVVFSVYSQNKDDACVFRYVFDCRNTVHVEKIPDQAGKLPPAVVKGGASVAESGALKLNGQSGYVEIPQSENIHITNGATFSAVVKFYEDGQEGGKPESHDMIFFKESEFLFGRTLKQLYFNFFDGTQSNWVAAVITGEITRGAWLHIAAVVERMDDAAQGGVKYKTTLFINGEPEISQKSKDIAPQAGTNAIEIGKGWGGPWFFNGEIAEVSMYNRPLTEPEIKGIFASAISPVRADYVLEEPFDAMPGTAFTGGRKDMGPVGGRLKNIKALQLKETYLNWDIAAEDDCFMEYWLKPVGWDGLSAKEIELSRFTIGNVAYRLYKAGGKSELILEADGEKLQSYPVYNWTEQPWMGDDARWHYINIQREGAGLNLTVDGFNARRLAAAKTEGTLSDFVLSGASGTAFSELRIMRGKLEGEQLRARYLYLYQGKPEVLLHVDLGLLRVFQVK